jgi:hypothetical protein
MTSYNHLATAKALLRRSAACGESIDFPFFFTGGEIFSTVGLAIDMLKTFLVFLPKEMRGKPNTIIAVWAHEYGLPDLAPAAQIAFIRDEDDRWNPGFGYHLINLDEVQVGQILVFRTPVRNLVLIKKLDEDEWCKVLLEKENPYRRLRPVGPWDAERQVLSRLAANEARLTKVRNRFNYGERLLQQLLPRLSDATTLEQQQGLRDPLTRA